MQPFPQSPERSARTALATIAGLLALALGCAESGMGGMAAAPETPWNQTLATQAADTLRQKLGALYQSALDEPSFAGERTEYSDLLDKLRILQEESNGLYNQLKDGKGRAETMDDWERIKEVSRDAREAESWQFIPEDFANTAKSTLAATDTLDAFYGTGSQ